MLNLIHLDYPLDKENLLEEASKIKADAKPYTDPRYTSSLDTWLSHSHHTSPYIEKVMQDFRVEGVANFYWQEPNSVLPMHTDYNTTCSLNFVLTPNPASIIINNIEYEYKQALLDTTQLHGVTTGDEERILFKISLFDKSFSEYSKQLPYNGSLGH
tara:strand:+ start:87 stop:557 length:471 start_codon:yes stop_codon:yes gene_type:complete